MGIFACVGYIELEIKLALPKGSFITLEMAEQLMRRRILRTFKNICFAAKDLPDVQLGRKEVWKIKAWLRQDASRWNANGFAYLRFQQKEFEATVKLAKYRAMKHR